MVLPRPISSAKMPACGAGRGRAARWTRPQTRAEQLARRRPVCRHMPTHTGGRAPPRPPLSRLWYRAASPAQPSPSQLSKPAASRQRQASTTALRPSAPAQPTVEALVVQRDQPVQPDLLVLAQLALDQKGGLHVARESRRGCCGPPTADQAREGSSSSRATAAAAAAWRDHPCGAARRRPRGRRAAAARALVTTCAVARVVPSGCSSAICASALWIRSSSFSPAHSLTGAILQRL